MAVLQEQKISPYLPDRTYNLGDNTGQFSDVDIGKAMKQDSAANLVQCAAEDNIMGIIAAVEPSTKDGHSQGAVACDVNAEMYAVDEAGTLNRDDIVVAGTQAAIGTRNPLARTGVYGPPVKVPTTPPATAPHLWVVVEVYGSGAGRGCLIRKIG